MRSSQNAAVSSRENSIHAMAAAFGVLKPERVRDSCSIMRCAYSA